MLNVEAALRFRQDLKLSDAQAAQLETLRKEIVAQRQAEARDAIDTHSRAAAGLISGDEIRKQFDSKRDDMRKRMQQHRERVAQILTAEQQQLLQTKTRERMKDGMHGRMRHREGRPGMGQGFRRGPRF
jgi:Spy/CpxP family protein refolding chaperone